jgi:hypothetical protein
MVRLHNQSLATSSFQILDFASSAELPSTPLTYKVQTRPAYGPAYLGQYMVDQLNDRRIL